MTYSIESKLGDLLDNATTNAILETYLPGLSKHPQVGMARGFTLAATAQLSKGLIPAEALAKIEVDLKSLDSKA
ncbi:MULTISPECIES: hypothetical protein [Pseudomonas]|uniref:hypothetical protein n=1 Tax=Pseudomonas TaxID=286 RepID=UPI00159FB473|nr:MULTISPECIES: hypothetical protein [Pseudomonas]NWC92984.1 hypothetical protein [Pseudomonas sp. IPO3779]NWD19402.1 hypothetical protein [Pseudomonas sp. IPO3778]NWE37040.1 hypothetical protein [Pseudomonas gingeri]